MYKYATLRGGGGLEEAQTAILPETWAHGVFLVVPLPPTALRLIVWFSTSIERTNARPFGPLTRSPMFAGGFGGSLAATGL